MIPSLMHDSFPWLLCRCFILCHIWWHLASSQTEVTRRWGWAWVKTSKSLEGHKLFFNRTPLIYCGLDRPQWLYAQHQPTWGLLPKLIPLMKTKIHHACNGKTLSQSYFDCTHTNQIVPCSTLALFYCAKQNLTILLQLPGYLQYIIWS